METPPVYAEAERLRDALDRIEQWCKAYPVSVFPPLSDETVRDAGAILRTHGISIGALHAQWARHILLGIADIITVAKGDL